MSRSRQVDRDPDDRDGVLEEAFALWREDADRGAAAFDADALTRRVLAGRGRAETVARATRRYAAAAVVLLGVGVAGAAAVGPKRAEADPPNVRSALQTLEKNRFGLVAEQEWTRFGVAAPPHAEEER